MPLFGERVCLTLGEQSSIELDVLASIWFDIIPTLQYQWETCTQLSIATGEKHTGFMRISNHSPPYKLLMALGSVINYPHGLCQLKCS